MTTPAETAAPTSIRRLFNRHTLIAFVAGAAIVAGVGAAMGDATGGWHHGMLMDGTHSAADISDHIDHVLKHLYVELDATDAQKAQIKTMMQAQRATLRPLMQQMAQNRLAVLSSRIGCRPPCPHGFDCRGYC